MKDPINIIGISAIIILLGALGYIVITNIPVMEERNEYCELNGYKESINSGIKELEGIKYIECYDEEIIDNHFVVIEEWIVFEDLK